MAKRVISIKYEGQCGGYLRMEGTSDGRGILNLDSTLPDGPETDCKLHITNDTSSKSTMHIMSDCYCFMFAADYFDMEDVGWGEAMGKPFREVRFRSHVHGLETKYITGYGMSYLVKGEVCENIEQLTIAETLLVFEIQISSCF